VDAPIVHDRYGGASVISAVVRPAALMRLQQLAEEEGTSVPILAGRLIERYVTPDGGRDP
jgi:hypothetical protein